jgi:leucyl/phenylalanyl-tRNA---protein transferase
VPNRPALATFSCVPVELPPSLWDFPDPSGAAGDLICVGADLEPATLISAYRRGLFPMPHGRKRRDIGWWSPNPRGIIPIDGFHESRSLRRARRRFEVTHDRQFTEVMRQCGDPRRPHGWINEPFIEAYSRLHQLGWASSTEVYDDTGELVGGVYGVRVGRLFAGESMFHRATDASKVALAALLDRLNSDGVELFDVQWTTPHLSSLGAIDISREEYLRRLAAAIG